MSKKLLIIGAGEAGRMVVREICAHSSSDLEIVGFLDDDLALQGRTIEGYPVLGDTTKLPEVANEKPVDEVIISVPSGSRDFVRRMVALCRDAKVSFKIVPGLIEIIRGPVHLEQIREVHPEDLLGRETVAFAEEAIGRELANRRVMVTGAGGSIGGEICRQLGRFDMGELQLFGRGENQIYAIEEEIRRAHPGLRVRPVIGDVRDGEGLMHAFKRLRPEFVYHAAAHKHVHYMEAHPEEAVKNNIFGTEHIIGASRETGVQRLVMLSTDKAVRPVGIMGASKRVAEYLMIHGSLTRGGPRLITVRFGNVLGSRGSVVPLFMRQIRRGGPVTVSDRETSRFFMTLKEACLLVVQASVMGKGGEVFILQMGEPIRIIEIAKDLIALHGLRSEIDVKIEFTGLRAGEKMHEDLVADGEVVEKSPHDFILTSRPELPKGWDHDRILERFKELTRRGDSDGIRDLLGTIIPDAKLRKV
ncbi:MAG: polysaccharide biosynthesis protein [Candidatus Krumholzibacteria bacterium]|nr:polysaccharide biosynthesis protein [Candidatus Krumholzibacteria bacterium]